MAELLVGLVRLTVAVGVLVTQGEEVTEEPLVVIGRASGPDSRRVILVSTLVQALLVSPFVTVEFPMSRRQQLGGFEDHLDHMAVTLHTGSRGRVVVKIEDINGYAP